MNPPVSNEAERARRFAEMLAKPPLLPDPVFPKDNYLEVFARSFFEMLVRQWQKPELVPQISTRTSNSLKVMLLVNSVGFWAYDFEEKSDQGVTGREILVRRVKDPILRPPAQMAAIAMEHHILAQGVVQIQTATGDALPGQYEVVKLKTVGWYAAELVSPKQ